MLAKPVTRREMAATSVVARSVLSIEWSDHGQCRPNLQPSPTRATLWQLPTVRHKVQTYMYPGMILHAFTIGSYGPKRLGFYN
jgi:hypothetical protein